MTIINNKQDTLDTRDILAYIEELEETEERDEIEELATLRQLIEEVEDYSGDKAANGICLIRDSYFTRYVQDYCDECGIIPKAFPTWIAIDWGTTARDFQIDYSSVEYNNITYWFR